jgi:hypothetical protein
MKKYFLLIIFLYAVYTNYAQYGKPVFYLKEIDPWGDVIGSEIPMLAIYDSGYILYTKVEDKRQKIYYVRVCENEKKELIADMREPVKKYLHQVAYDIELTGWTDQPTTIFYFNYDTIKVARVYGSMSDTSYYDKKISEYGKGFEMLLVTYEYFKKYNNKNAKEWLPDKIEVMLWDYSHSSSTGIAWPKEWPGFKDKATVSRGDGLYSIYINKKDFSKLKNYIKKVKENGGNTVILNKKKWAISYRLPFPGIK